MISNIAEIRQRVDAAIAERTGPAWDKRPGELEATSGLAIVGAAGVRALSGWVVRLLISGGVQVEPLSIGAARRHAAEILQLCDTLEQGVPD